MKNPLLISVSVVVAALLTPTAITAPIALEQFSPGAGLITFDNLSPGEVVTSQYASRGVTFINPDYTSSANEGLATLIAGQSDPNLLFIEQHDGLPFGRPQRILFASPMLRVGAFFETSLNSTITMMAFAPDNTLLESLTLTGTFDDPDFLTGFIGLEQASGIGRVDLFSRSNRPDQANFNFGIDDLRFEPVPEPSAWALSTLGLLGIIFRRHDRAHDDLDPLS